MVLAVENCVNNVFKRMFRFSLFSSAVPIVGFNVCRCVDVKTLEESTTLFPTGSTAGIMFVIIVGVTNAIVLGATFNLEIEKCFVTVAESYIESVERVPVIITTPSFNNVTMFPLMVAFVVSEDVYVHAPVLLFGLVGFTIENDTSLNDLFDMARLPTWGINLFTTSSVVDVPDV